MANKKLLITGAFGLVGSNICKVLERDYPDIEVHKVKYDEIMAVQHNDFEKFTQFDFIIHAAGYGQPIKFTQNKIDTIRINTGFVNDLFGMLRVEGKILFVSTSEVYSGAKSPYAETDIGTTTPQHPRACYIEGKRCGEAICASYRELGYDAKVARLALAYGPGTKKGDTRVINQFIEQAITTGEIKLMDKGEAIRTYGYIDDVVGMLLDILFNGSQPVYNVGGASTVSILQLANMIADLTKSKVTLGKEGLKGAPDDVKLSLALIMTEFPRPLTALAEGLKKTIEYQQTLYV